MQRGRLFIEWLLIGLCASLAMLLAGRSPVIERADRLGSRSAGGLVGNIDPAKVRTAACLPDLGYRFSPALFIEICNEDRRSGTGKHFGDGFPDARAGAGDKSGFS